MKIPSGRIERIEKAAIVGERWRDIGCNARKGVHGRIVPNDIVRITIDGVKGFGWSKISKEQAERLIGVSVADLFLPNGRIRPEYRNIEYPVLDWCGQIYKLPVYALADGHADETRPLQVPCYETTLYFDDLPIGDDREAVEFMQKRALEGWDYGFRAFKIKVGRGARHMSLEHGTKRDIEIIKGIREAVGSAAKIMIDANNSYNLNLAKEVLYATADAQLTFIEEAFYEDPILYEDLKNWMSKEKIQVMIADGEGLIVAPSLIDWAKQGLIDIVQYDIRWHGFNNLLDIEDDIKGTGIWQAPHNYGGPYGNYATCHIAPFIQRFMYIEWDEVRLPGLDASAYKLVDGMAEVPFRPGFGLQLDEDYFLREVLKSGWVL
ncbi:enolase C-terminal domain-like protein [Paenibacillus thailandensis]|uniref:Enolase C-terminal domain-like protein n=1 Tax=Paenibacillus thailandensis TaxID=393250 RepID=A0ABW5QVC8_9BACL